MLNKLLGKDRFVLVVSTVLLGMLFIVLSEHDGMHAVLVGVAAAICALSVQLHALMREVTKLRQEVQTKQAHGGASGS
jgi:hypothetical protein